MQEILQVLLQTSCGALNLFFFISFDILLQYDTELHMILSYEHMT